ncbi:MAG: transposase [Akkermansiaceae bacterium]|nr:transposase [Akkermansiaceae bacterium]
MEDGLPPEPPGKAPASSDGDAPGEAAEVGGAKADKARRGRGGHRSRITGLDRLEVELTEDIPALVKEDPEAFERCGGGYRPARRDATALLHQAGDCGRSSAAGGPSPAAGGGLAPATPLVGSLPAADCWLICWCKYVDHLPLYRQQGIFRRSGLDIPRDLIVHWIHQAIELVLPVAQAIRAETLACDYLQVDETTVRYLRPGTGKSWMGYLWQARCPGGGGVFYHWGVGRSRDELVECIGELRRHACDAYRVYETYARTRRGAAHRLPGPYSAWLCRFAQAGPAGTRRWWSI